jgi:cytoskeletal protein CcmA (bactofilin family)
MHASRYGVALKGASAALSNGWMVRCLFAGLFAVGLMLWRPAEGMAASFVTEAPNAAVDDDLYFLGQTLELDFPVRGDVVFLAQRVYINAPVQGMVMGAAQEVVIGPKGEVSGSVRAAAQSVRVNGKVSGDVLAAANDVWIGREGSVGRDALLAGSTLEVGGTVGRRLAAGGNIVTISGRVAGPVSVDASRVDLTATARLDQGMTYSAESEARIEPGARISGSVKRVERPRNGSGGLPSVGSVIVDRLKSMVAPLLLGLLLILLFPAPTAAVAELALRRLLPSFGIGILAFLLIPLSLLILFVATLFIGGVVVPAVLAGVFAFILSLGNVVVGIALGAGVLRLLRVQVPWRRRLRMLSELVLGVLILTVVSVVPVVNVAVSVVTLALTLGAVILAYFEGRQLLQWGLSTSPGEMTTSG